MQKYKIQTGFIVGVVTLFAAFFTFLNQARIAEPVWIATHGFVRQQLQLLAEKQKSSLHILDEQQIELARQQLKSQRDYSEDTLFNLKVMEKKQNLPPSISQNIARQIQTLHDRISDINSRLRSLHDGRNLP